MLLFRFCFPDLMRIALMFQIFISPRTTNSFHLPNGPSVPITNGGSRSGRGPLHWLPAARVCIPRGPGWEYNRAFFCFFWGFRILDFSCKIFILKHYYEMCDSLAWLVTVGKVNISSRDFGLCWNLHFYCGVYSPPPSPEL